ncbi:hypothetical protein CRI93_10120 [Longimonas halophila]|uniref:Uncharacterized protein n=1 Tax=Longimonas halophila TaxID=1469170 RepID=A0A2H3NK04_9BACT|nr:hypothetical protein [Longimonas halophila]PEN06175.1 hypothetical protein CRI93_10120 [Longimonas halophila]
MPNATAKALEQRLLRAFPPNQPYVPDDWRTAAVPSVVQSFLQHRLLEQLDEVIHSMRQEEMAWVNDSDPELESARAAFEEALRANGQIPESDWPRMVRQAAHVGVSYLVRPVPTATAYLFEGRDTTLSVAYIAYRMQALAPYEYLRKGLDAFARHREVQRLDAKTFRETLMKVDRILTRDYSVDRWLDTLQPLFDAAEAAYGDPGCPVRVLHPFFAHKEQTVYADRLRALDDNRSLTQDELRSVLADTKEAASPPLSSARPTASSAPPEDTLNTQANEPSPPAEPTSNEPPRESSSFEQPSETSSDAEDIAEASSDTASLWGRPSERNSDSSDADASSTSNSNAATEHSAASNDSTHEPTWDVPSGPRPVSSDASATSSEDDSSNGPTPRWKQFHRASGSASPQAPSASDESAAGGTARWKQFGQGSTAQRTPTNDAAASPTPDQLDALESDALGDLEAGRRRLFVDQLFDGSTARYAKILSALGDATSWREASQIIAQDVFRRNKINIYSDAAVNFTNAVERRYR